jgi:hypothetical protein
VLEAFEARLADLLADALAGTAGLAVPSRGPPDAIPAADVAPFVQVIRAETEPVLGDDAPVTRRVAGSLRLRTVLVLHGEVRVSLVAANDVAQPARLAALDTVLVALQDESVRQGRAFDDDTDQGFELRGFRFLRAAPAGGSTPLSAATWELVFAYEGDFWPVRPEPEGPAITTIPRRLVPLPVAVPEVLSARAGGADVTIPLQLDLRTIGGAAPRVVARLRGAAPPGTLLGDAAGAPPGFVSVPVDADGIAELDYRPPAVLAAPTRVRIAASLAGEDRPTVALAELVIQVMP